MTRLGLLVGLLLALALAACAAVTVTINGKTVTVSTIEANGKAYVDVQALLKLLGGSATYDAKTHAVAITAPASSAASVGTAELAGENGVFGKVYAIRKITPLYFTLTKAEYTTHPVVIGTRLLAPDANEKLLVLHFTVQNPNKTDTLVRFDSLRFMAVDAMNVNHNAIVWGDEETRLDLNMMLKPAQKIAAYTVITVPAAGVVPKLMVQPNGTENGPVLRYDLRDKVAALQPPIADPADATGATALAEVPAAMNAAYPFQRFTATVEKTEYSTAALDRGAPKAGDRYLIVTLLAKNNLPTDQLLRFDTFTARVISTDGEEFRSQGLLFATAERPFAQPVKGLAEARVRLYFTVPKGVTPKSFSLQEAKSRTYLFELTE